MYLISIYQNTRRPPRVIGFHTLCFGSVRMFLLGILGFAVYGNEALHFSCDPADREVNLFCNNQFSPKIPQVILSLSLSLFFRLQTQLFGFEVNAIYMCNVAALHKIFNITSCMVPEGIENTIFLPDMYTFTVITLVLCVAEFFEVTFRRLCFIKSQ
ncbi:LOW QUALITY PROTEIN: putative gap junction epsilon-1 protein [Mergus octosetaceus]